MLCLRLPTLGFVLFDDLCDLYRKIMNQQAKPSFSFFRRLPTFDFFDHLNELGVLRRPYHDRHGVLEAADKFLLRQLVGKRLLRFIAGVVEKAVYLSLQERGVVQECPPSTPMRQNWFN